MLTPIEARLMSMLDESGNSQFARSTDNNMSNVTSASKEYGVSEVTLSHCLVWWSRGLGYRIELSIFKVFKSLKYDIGYSLLLP